MVKRINMKFNCFYILTVLVMVLSLLLSCSGNDDSNSEENKGSLVIVGGALESSNSSIFKKYIELGGGITNIRIAIVPTATSTPAQSGTYYKNSFAKYGVPKPNIWIVPIAEQDDIYSEVNEAVEWEDNGFNPEVAKKLESYNAVWFTGGWQGRTRNLLMKNEDGKWIEGVVLKTIRNIYKNGGVIGGTSAGAAIMTDPMIDGGSSLGALLQGHTEVDKFSDKRNEQVYLTKGVGFWDGGMVGQHFIKRGRFGRLIAAMFASGETLGIGIDENTAAVVRGNEIEVFGETGIIIIDLDDAVLRNKTPLRAENIRLSYIEEKDKYNFETKEFTFARYKNEELKGREGSNTPPNLNGNVFNKDALLEHMIFNLVDNTHKENYGIAFDSRGYLRGVNEGEGVKVRFYKKDDTNGVWGRKVFSGKARFSVYNVYLDISGIIVEFADID